MSFLEDNLATRFKIRKIQIPFSQAMIYLGAYSEGIIEDMCKDLTIRM